jgi:hypothetical protein
VLREQLRANPANAPVLGQALSAIETLEQGKRPDTSAMHPALLPLFGPQLHGFLISLMSHDPAELVAATEKPVLILQGQRDIQVSEADARRLSAANPRAKLVMLSSVTHVLKEAANEDPQSNMATYTDGSLPIAPAVTEAIADFMKSH